MKKYFFILLLLVLATVPFSTPVQAKAVESNQQSYAYLGYFVEGGIEYHLYGTWPTITSVVPSSGSVTSFTGNMYISSHWDPQGAGIDSVNIQMYTSGGYVQYNGVVFQ